jgi:hypothetical protein
VAGLGWRSFADGQVLTGAQVQQFLQDQAVMVFGSSAARSSALGTVVSAGMVSYRTDASVVESYRGTAWSQLMWANGTAVDSTRWTGRALTVGTAQPGSPAVGDIWIQV